MKNLLRSFFPIAWIGHLGLGLSLGIMGPVQPYLASQVGVSHQEISWMWSCRAMSVGIACLISGILLSLKIFQNQNQKVLTFALAKLSVFSCLIFLPFINNFTILLVVIFMLYFSAGFFDNGDNALVINMLGPQKSRPFIQSLHACTAIGFVVVAMLIPLFLPDSNESRDEICEVLHHGLSKIENLTSHLQTTNSEQNYTSEDIVEGERLGNNLPLLFWPFLLIGFWEFIVSVGFLAQGCSSVVIPNFYSQSPAKMKTTEEMELNEEKKKLQESELLETEITQPTRPKDHNQTAVLFSGFFFFILSAGVDAYFQSQTYTYGLCGPMELTPAQAGHLNTTYFATYLVGRILSIPLSRHIHPRIILIVSLFGCFATSILLFVSGDSNPYFLYLGTGLMGFFMCFEFGSGLTWLADMLPNLKPHHTSFMFIGGTAGWFVFPMLASQLFEVFGPTSVFYLTLILTGFHCLIFVIMLKFL